MARADESPHERDIAREKLQAMGEGWGEPPRRPPASPAPAPVPRGWGVTTTSTTNGSYAHFTFTVTFEV